MLRQYPQEQGVIPPPQPGQQSSLDLVWVAVLLLGAYFLFFRQR